MHPHILPLCAAASGLLLLAACTPQPRAAQSDQPDETQGERHIITRDFPITEDFYQITNVSSFQVEISEGPCSVTAIGDSAVISAMRCSVTYGGLTLSTPLEENYDVTPWAMDNTTRVIVQLPQLRILANCGSGNITYKGTLRTPRIHMGGMGSGTIEMDSIVCGHFRYECTRATQTALAHVLCDTAEIVVYGEGNTDIGVEASEMVVCDLSGQSGLTLRAKAPLVYAYSTTSADATLDVQTEDLTVDWRGTGIVTLLGQAKEKDVRSSRMGTMEDKVTIR